MRKKKTAIATVLLACSLICVPVSAGPDQTPQIGIEAEYGLGDYEEYNLPVYGSGIETNESSEFKIVPVSAVKTTTLKTIFQKYGKLLIFVGVGIAVGVAFYFFGKNRKR